MVGFDYMHKRLLTGIKNTLRRNADMLMSEYNVEKIGIFGSAVQGRMHKDSDIDLLVDLKKPIGLFKFIELEDFLSEALGRKIDLVTKKALKQVIRKEVLRNIVYV